MIKNTVLLVEDEMLVGIELQMAFEDDGWNVDGPYATAAQAIVALNADNPNCAVLDIGLIDADVFAAADGLTVLGIPFLFHTGRPETKTPVERYPRAPVVSKPAAPAIVVQAALNLAN